MEEIKGVSQENAPTISNGDMIYWNGKTWIVDRIAKNNTLVLLDCYTRQRFMFAFPPINKVCFVATFDEWLKSSYDYHVSVIQVRIEKIRESNQYEKPVYQTEGAN